MTRPVPQLELFVTTEPETYRLSRGSDPATSKQADADIRPKLSGLYAEFVERLSQLGRATANEVADGNESLRKRARYLVDAREIKTSGTKVCSRTGKEVTAYEVAK